MGVEYLSTDCPVGSDPNWKTVLDSMRESVQRADTIIHGLLDFSASNRWEAQEEDLNATIEQSLRLVHHDLVKARVKVDASLGGNLPLLKLNRTKMEQVFINLFVNAVHAMPKGGTLSVRTHTRASTAHNGIAEKPATAIVVEVADTGTGIPPEILPKIIEPFFTTKPAGVGTGLGLSVVKNIVELHGGTFAMANRPEGGAQATITFNLQQGETKP
jgi:signal transduction histidine kinase